MKAMICPQCGGKIDKVFESKTLAECSYCGARVLLQPVEEPVPEPGVRDTSRVPLEDYKPFDDYEPYSYESEPSGEAYDTTFEEYAGTLNKTGFKVIGISAAVCFGLFVVILGVALTRKRPDPVSPFPRTVYQAPSTPAVVRPTAPSVTNADAVTMPAPVLPPGTRVARKTQIKVYVTVEDNGHVYEAQAHEGPEPLKKAAVEAANKAKFKVRTDKQWSSGVLVYDFGIK
jgi:DNA-directed RNA polymerase subunit RPC12/RpoP